MKQWNSTCQEPYGGHWPPNWLMSLQGLSIGRSIRSLVGFKTQFPNLRNDNRWHYYSISWNHIKSISNVLMLMVTAPAKLKRGKSWKTLLRNCNETVSVSWMESTSTIWLIMYLLSRSTVKTFNNSQGTSADINKIQQWFIANIDGSAYHWTKFCDWMLRH